MIALAAILVALALASRRSSTTASGGNTLTPAFDVEEWTAINTYRDSNGIVWSILERAKGTAYRGVAGPGPYAGRTFTLPSWLVLRNSIDAYAATQKPGASTPTVPPPGTAVIAGWDRRAALLHTR